MNSGRRQPLPDALRALALLGVVVVNAAGYASAPQGPILGHARPADDPLAWAVQGLQAWLLQGKAYPALAFLFGWGMAMALQDRSAASADRARRRQWRLLQLGVLHGAVLYFGDILAMYGLCGFWLLKSVRARWRVLRSRIKVAGLWALGLSISFTAVGALLPAPSPDEPGFAKVQTMGGFLEMNLLAFTSTALPSMVVGAPVVVLCMLIGITAARLRLLTHLRWQAWRRAQVERWLVPVLLWNLVYAAALVMNSNDMNGATLWIDGTVALFGLPLSAMLILALAQAWDDGHLTWASRLVPLGQRTLTLYLGHSLWCALLFSGVGLGWQPGTVGVFCASVGFWLLAAAAATFSQGRWPLEAWMGRGA